MVLKIIICILTLTIIGYMYYISHQIIELDSKIEQLRTQNTIINTNIEIVHEVIKILIISIREKLNIFL